jgi:outer membrane lipoprotein SlyB
MWGSQRFNQMNEGLSMTTTSNTLPTPPRTGFARNAWIAAGGLALAAAGLAAGLAWRPAPQTELMAPASMEATKASLASNELVVDAAKSTADNTATTTTMPKEPTAPAAPAKKAPAKKAPPAQRHASNGVTTAQAPQAAPVCAHCGVVEGVHEVTVKGKGTGLGAVAGGVLGGAVGNHMGKGNGRTAMTVLGAIGGGLAGNEVEKRARAEILYDVRVRMDDGSVRTIQQKTAPATGSRVTVEGNTLRVTSSGSGNA